jgi:hypothetical protein
MVGVLFRYIERNNQGSGAWLRQYIGIFLAGGEDQDERAEAPDAKEAGGGGGKNVLTHFFEYLRDNASLLDHSQPDAKLVMFYMDKDVDDFLGKLRISDHVVYTQYYGIENHLFAEGDLISSIATAGSIDVNLVRPRIPAPLGWRAQAAQYWREWVALCLLARKLMMPQPVSYAAPQSGINSPPDSAVDQVALAAHVAQMKAQSRLAAADFDRKLAATYRLVEAIYRRPQHDLLFKGKWYVVFVLCELGTASGGVYDTNGAAGRLIGSLIATVNFSGQWTEHFRHPLRQALAQL